MSMSDYLFRTKNYDMPDILLYAAKNEFDKYFVEQGFNEQSTSYAKMLRGWLMRADYSYKKKNANNNT